MSEPDKPTPGKDDTPSAPHAGAHRESASPEGEQGDQKRRSARKNDKPRGYKGVFVTIYLVAMAAGGLSQAGLLFLVGGVLAGFAFTCLAGWDALSNAKTGNERRDVLIAHAITSGVGGLVAYGLGAVAAFFTAPG